MLFLNFAHAADDSVDYVDVKKGDVAEFDGKLFKNESIAKILADHQSEIQKKEVEFNYSLEKTKLDLGLKYDILKAQRDAEVEMYTSMIKARDEYIEKSVKKDRLQKWAVYGSFMLGAATSVAIFYSVNYN